MFEAVTLKAVVGYPAGVRTRLTPSPAQSVDRELSTPKAPRGLLVHPPYTECFEKKRKEDVLHLKKNKKCWQG